MAVKLMLKLSALSKALYPVGVRLLGTLAQLLLVSLISDRNGHAALGNFFVELSVISFLSVATLMGNNTWLLRTAAVLDRDFVSNAALLARALRTFGFLAIPGSSLGLLILMQLSIIKLEQFNRLLAATLAYSIIKMTSDIYKGRGASIIAIFLEYIAPHLLASVLIILTDLDPLTCFTAALVSLVLMIGGYISLFLGIWRHLSAARENKYSGAFGSKKVNGLIYTRSLVGLDLLGYWISQTFTFAWQSLPYFLLNYYNAGADTIANYGIAHKFTGVISTVSQAIAIRYSRDFAAAELPTMRKQLSVKNSRIHNAAAQILMISIIWLFLPFLAEKFFSIGEKNVIQEIRVLFALMLVSRFVYMFTGLVDFRTVLSGKPWYDVLANTVSFILVFAVLQLSLPIANTSKAIATITAFSFSAAQALRFILLYLVK